MSEISRILPFIAGIARERGYTSGDDWLIPLVNRLHEDIDRTIPMPGPLKEPCACPEEEILFCGGDCKFYVY